MKYARAYLENLTAPFYKIWLAKLLGTKQVLVDNEQEFTFYRYKGIKYLTHYKKYN